MDPKEIEEIMNVIKEFFPENTSIAISDTKEYIYYQPSKLVDLKIKPGDPIKEGSAAYKAIQYGKKINNFIESDVFGVPYYGMSIPLITEGEIKGAVTAIFPQKPSPFLTNLWDVQRAKPGIRPCAGLWTMECFQFSRHPERSSGCQQEHT